MARQPENHDALRQARRGLAWAFLLSLVILAGVVALLSGLTLIRLLPYAGLLAASSDVLTLPSGERVHPAWFRVAGVTFAVSMGLGVASVWGLLWLRQRWAKSSSLAKPDRPPPSRASNKPKKKRKR